jgi:Double zinc ribbon
MALATFGISDNGLNLVVNLLILGLVVVWLALIVYTYLDARRRVSDPFLVACATIAAFIPYIGTAVYAILRPPEFLEDAHERELEIRAAELRVRQLTELSCPNCEYPVEKNFLRCPNCQRRLKDPCPTCSKPVDPRWALCPYCETALSSGGERKRRPAKKQQPRRKKAPVGTAEKASASSARKEPPRRASREGPDKQPEQRSPSREPDPDPRQA